MGTSVTKRPTHPSIVDTFDMNKTIGSGAFSEVKEVIHKENGTKCAVKILKKNVLKSSDISYLKEEIRVLQCLNHPHIVKLYGVSEEPYHYYLVTELVQGGELLRRVQAKKKHSDKIYLMQSNIFTQRISSIVI